MKSVKLKEKSKLLQRAAYVAFPHSVPILAGYGFLGLAYGILMSVNGFSPLFTMMMSLLVFGGSVQIVAVELMTAAFAPPVIRTLGLHLFEDVENENERALKGENLASLSTASVEYSNENKTAVVAFGGIYPFDTVEFSLTEDGEFEIESFSGQCFQPAARGKTENGRACVNTPNSVCGSYQIRIKASAPIDTEKTITVKLAK